MSLHTVIVGLVAWGVLSACAALFIGRLIAKGHVAIERDGRQGS